MFRIDRPTGQDLGRFFEQGYVTFPRVLTERGCRGLVEEILSSTEVVRFLALTDEERGRLPKPHRLSVIGWNDKGPIADQLFDAPLVRALLESVIGEPVQFCHSTIRVSMRGSLGLALHHDSYPTNLAERGNWYVQMLYYPTGFRRGDAGLSVVPGSHRITDWGDHEPHGPPFGETTLELLDELYGEQIGRPLRVEELELPPGSMVFMDARLFHAVSPKPLDSPEPMRLFCNYLFKQPGGPHPKTQEIPHRWLDGASSFRRGLFTRAAHSEA